MSAICNHNSCVHSSLQGLSNGFTYGAKVRFTHSLVIAVLFSKEPYPRRLKRILTNTLEHGRRLGLFVFLFKSIVCILNRLRRTNSASHHFISGLIASFIVWREENSINTQITLYLLSRILVGGAKVLYQKSGMRNPFIERHGMSTLTLLSWASSMFLFDHDPDMLQASMASSMKFLYVASNKWLGWLECAAGTFTKLFSN